MIGVIICNYNRVDRLEQCLKAVTQQLYCPLDVCVVDDGSTDGSIEFLEKCGIKYYAREGRKEGDLGNLSTSWNKGLQLLRGDVEQICLLQCDIIPFPMYFRWMKELCGPGRAVCGLPQHLSHELVSDTAIKALYTELTGWEPPGRQRYHACYQHGARTLIELEDWRQVDGPDMCIHRQDFIQFDEELVGAGHHIPEWCLRLRMRNVRFYTTPLMRLIHMHHPGSHTEPDRHGSTPLQAVRVEANQRYIEQKYGPHVFSVGSTSNAFVRDGTMLAGPLTHTALTYLAHMEVPNEDRFD